MPPTTPSEPFWNHLRGIARYPFTGSALASLITLTLLNLLAVLPFGGWMFGLIVQLAACRYAFEILVHTARGHMEPPDVSIHTHTGTVVRFLLLCALVAALLIAVQLWVDKLAFVVLMSGISLLLPGSIMSLAIDGSLLRALNPLTPLAMMNRIGASYFTAFGLLFVIQISAATAGDLLADFVPLLLVDSVVTLTWIWGLFAAFHLMGYLVFQHRDVLGFEVEPQPARSGRRPRDVTLTEHTESSLAEGDVDTALARIREEMRERAVPLETHQLFRRLLRSRGAEADLVAHAGPYLNLLLLEKREREALALLRETLSAEPSFTPHEAEDGERLARRAQELGLNSLAIDIWLAMLKRWPRNPARVNWALATAPLLAQRNRLQEARALLQESGEKLEDPKRKAAIDAALEALPEA